jgi:glycosyltransferase involved in cell wall biosynthesis
MTLSIIIPVYNEEMTILAIVQEAQNTILPKDIKKEIIIVNDGSTDSTADQLNKINHSPAVRIFHLASNQGKTAAVKHGLTQSTGDIILIQDADLEYSPSHYSALLEPILRGKASVVYGSRFKGQITGMTFINRLANRISNLTINMLFGSHLTDFHTCFKMFKRDALKTIDITSQNFIFDTEITAKLLANGYEIYEVPIIYNARKRSAGKKITWRLALETYFFLIKFRMTYRKS